MCIYIYVYIYIYIPSFTKVKCHFAHAHVVKWHLFCEFGEQQCIGHWICFQLIPHEDRCNFRNAVFCAPGEIYYHGQSSFLLTSFPGTSQEKLWLCLKSGPPKSNGNFFQFCLGATAVRMVFSYRRWTMKSNPCCIIVNPRTPKFQCCLWAARLGPVDKKIKPWTQRKLDRVLCNIEIWGVGFYLRFDFFVHLLSHAVIFFFKKYWRTEPIQDLLHRIFHRYPCQGIAQSSFNRDPVKEILRTIFYPSQRELAEDTLVSATSLELGNMKT